MHRIPVPILPDIRMVEYPANLKAGYRISGEAGYRISGRIIKSTFQTSFEYDINKETRSNKGFLNFHQRKNACFWKIINCASQTFKLAWYWAIFSIRQSCRIPVPDIKNAWLSGRISGASLIITRLIHICNLVWMPYLQSNRDGLLLDPAGLLPAHHLTGLHQHIHQPKVSKTLQLRK
jgi:hypothetical protein